MTDRISADGMNNTKGNWQSNIDATQAESNRLQNAYSIPSGGNDLGTFLIAMLCLVVFWGGLFAYLFLFV